MTGCVTTVPITHATPAGFCVATKSRNSQETIAEMYLNLKFDIMMGGGNEYFSSEHRKDKKDLLIHKKNSDMPILGNSKNSSFEEFFFCLF